MPNKTEKLESNQQMIIDLIKEISGQANLLTIPKIFITLTGDLKAAIFLSQCIYWSDRSSSKDGWFYKSYDDWKDEIGLSHREIERIRKDLIDRKFLEYDVRQAPPHDAPTCFYKINLEVIYQTIQETIPYREKGKSDIAKRESPYREKGKSDNDKSAKSLNRILHNLPPEPTTEITSSSFPLPNYQEEVEEVTNLEKLADWAAPKKEPQLSEPLIIALEEVDVFESLYAEIVASGWTEDQLLELIRRVKKTNVENPGAIFMWRLRNQKPPRAARTPTLDYAMPALASDEPEIPVEIYDAWERTLSQLSLEVNKLDYSTWFESLSIARYNGSLVLRTPNPFVIDRLRELNYDEAVMGNIFSNYLGHRVPVQFEVG